MTDPIEVYMLAEYVPYEEANRDNLLKMIESQFKGNTIFLDTGDSLDDDSVLEDDFGYWELRPGYGFFTDPEDAVVKIGEIGEDEIEEEIEALSERDDEEEAYEEMLRRYAEQASFTGFAHEDDLPESAWRTDGGPALREEDEGEPEEEEGSGPSNVFARYAVVKVHSANVIA